MSSLSAAVGNDQMIFSLPNMRKQIYLPKNIHTTHTKQKYQQNKPPNQQEERKFSIQDTENMVSNYLQTLK